MDTAVQCTRYRWAVLAVVFFASIASAMTNMCMSPLVGDIARNLDQHRAGVSRFTGFTRLRYSRRLCARGYFYRPVWGFQSAHRDQRGAHCRQSFVPVARHWLLASGSHPDNSRAWLRADQCCYWASGREVVSS